ncbi:MAG: DnaJ domain-containing protein [Chloroflexota bacterium]
MAEGGPCRCGRGTLYDVLQVSPWCEPEVIQAAFRALARTRHPDVNRDRDAEEQMRRLNVAYQTLSDPVKRARYDEELALESARIAQPRPAPAPNAAASFYAAAPAPGTQSRRARPTPTSAPNARDARDSHAYQAMIFDQRGEGLLPRSALYLLVVLATLILALIAYIFIDVMAADRPIAPRGPRSQQDAGWTETATQSSRTASSWWVDGLPDDPRPGLSQAGERWNP